MLLVSYVKKTKGIYYGVLRMCPWTVGRGGGGELSRTWP